MDLLEDFMYSKYMNPIVSFPVYGTDFDHIKRHYYYSHTRINPTRVIPKGPGPDLNSDQQRDINGIGIPALRSA